MLAPGEATRAGLHGGEWIAAGLLGLFRGGWLAWSELGTAVIAIGAVMLGVRTARHDRWLVARHKAERLRLLKFRYLTAPALWSDSAEGRARLRRWLDQEVEAIAAIDRRDLRRWSEEDSAPEPPAYVPQAHIDEAALDELVRYQLHKRLALQTTYLARQAGRHRRQEWRMHDLTRFFFLASVFVVGWHVVHAWGRSGVQPTPLGVVLKGLPLHGRDGSDQIGRREARQDRQGGGEGERTRTHARRGSRPGHDPAGDRCVQRYCISFGGGKFVAGKKYLATHDPPPPTCP